MRTKWPTLLSVLGLLCAVLCMSCAKQQSGPSHSVLVIHSYQNEGDEGEPFRKNMQKEFEKQGIKANIHHIYLDHPYNDREEQNEHIFPAYLDSIQNLWKPEIILLNDDPAYHYAVNHNQDSLFMNLPVVFSGVTMLYTERLADYPNFTGFEDIIDFTKNCELLHVLFQDPVIFVELDTLSYSGKELYSQLQTALSDTTRYLSREEANRYLQDKSQVDLKDRLCVNIISSLDQDAPLQEALQHTFLNVKRDIVSNTLLDLSEEPSVTAIREGFNNPKNPRFLAGYFTRQQTQIADEVSYAVQILNGATPKDLLISSHRKEYCMDYNVLEQCQNTDFKHAHLKDLSYEKQKELFHFVNVPYHLLHPKSYLVFQMGIIGLGMLLLVLLAYFYYRMRNREIQQKNLQRENEAHLRAQILTDSNSAVWRSNNGMIEFPLEFAEKMHIPKKLSVADSTDQLIHPDSLTEWQRIINYQNCFGKQKARIRVTFDREKTWHWYDIIFNVTPLAIQRKQLIGLFINVDEEIERTEQLQKALAQAREIKVKEHFLENISVNLQAPLQQVSYHARLLSDPGNQATESEMKDYYEKIQEGVSTLLENIDSVVQNSSKVFFWALLFTASALLSSCQKEKKEINVLLLHQYSAQLTGYTEFHEALTQEFLDNGFNPNYHSIYLDLEDQSLNEDSIRSLYRDTILAARQTADVILAEGDRTLRYTFDLILDEPDKQAEKIPVIFGGIANPDWAKISRYNNVIVINDPLDLAKNIDLACELTHKHCVTLELDYFADDNYIRYRMNQDLIQSPYENLSDFHREQITKELLENELKDSLVVRTLSIHQPERNARKLLDKERARTLLQQEFIGVGRNPQLVVKKDLYGERLVNMTNHTEFTTCRELLGNGKGKYLAGYFADYATVGKDLAVSAVSSLDGLRNMAATRTHAKHYFMDYEAMQLMGLNYQDYKQHYTIKNAPQSIENPLVYWGKLFALLVALCMMAFLLFSYLQRKQRSRLYRLETLIQDDRNLSLMALQGARNHYIANLEEMEQVINLIDPVYTEQKEAIRATLSTPGNYKFRIKAAIEADMQKGWWQLRYATATDKQGKTQLEGLLININESMAYEQEVKQAEALEEESKKKEKFLWKIAHEIRTPLNSIQGFAELLTTNPSQLNYSEKQEMCLAIQESSDALQKIITDIIQYAHIINNKETYDMKVVHLHTFMTKFKESQEAWIKRCNMELKLVQGRHSLYVRIDEEKLKAALRQLVDNARKFTRIGVIAIGWDYDLNNHIVSIFVEDSGPGIPEDKLPALFSMFWKNNSFIPGVGIGLNIAESYVKAMGGTVSVETEERVGSRFLINLPIQQTTDPT